MASQPSHEIEPVVDDHEQFGFPGGRDIENQLNANENYRKNVYRSLSDCAVKDDWRVAEPILKKYPSSVAEKITPGGETLLHIATKARSIRFVGELLKVMEVSDLELKDNIGNTAFAYAALSRFIELAKAMVERNKNLPNIPGNTDVGKVLFPISLAAVAGFKDMVSYLFDVTNLDMIHQEERLFLLDIIIHNDMYEEALNIFNKDRKLASKILEGNARVLYTLSQKSLSFSNQEVKSKGKFINVISMARNRFITWVLPKRYVLKQQAGVLLEELWAECERSSEDKLLELVIKESLLHSAAKAGNVEFLAVVIRNYPDLIRDLEGNWSIFHIAVIYREEKVFSLIHQIEGPKNLLLLIYDSDGNNMLHLAARLGYSHLNDKEKIMPPSFLSISGAALQMQREILWFKEVEKLLPPLHQKMTNNDGKTPRELFTEEHMVLLKEGESWMKHTTHSCMIVATLIATMVFAAGFTVPGGNDDDNGIPILLKFKGFRVFVISDAVARFSSIISIIMFLSILTSRYAEDDFLVSLPAKLLFGLTALFVSIVSMLLAFTATFFLVYSNRMGYWEPKFIAACAGVPVALFGCLQYKLWFDVAKSTYWSKFLFRSGKHKLY